MEKRPEGSDFIPLPGKSPESEHRESPQSSNETSTNSEEKKEPKTDYTKPKIYDIVSSDIAPIKNELDDLSKKVRSVEIHAKTNYKFLSYMALVIAALSFCFSVYLFNQSMDVSSRLDKSIRQTRLSEENNARQISNLEARLARTEIDHNLYLRTHLNEYLDETLIKLNTIKRILDTEKQEELELVIEQVQNIKNGVRTK